MKNEQLVQKILQRPKYEYWKIKNTGVCYYIQTGLNVKKLLFLYKNLHIKNASIKSPPN